MTYFRFLMTVGDVPVKIISFPKIEWTKEGLDGDPTFETVTVFKDNFSIPDMDITADDIYLLEVLRGFNYPNIAKTFKNYYTYSDELQRDLSPIKLIDLETGATAVSQGSIYNGDVSPWEFFTPAGNSLGTSTWFQLNYFTFYSTSARKWYRAKITPVERDEVDNPSFTISASAVSVPGAVSNFLQLSTEYDSPYVPKKVPETSEEYYSIPCEIFDNNTGLKINDYNLTFPKLKKYNIGFNNLSEYGFTTWHTSGIAGNGYITDKYFIIDDYPQIFTNYEAFSNIGNTEPPYVMNNYTNIWTSYSEIKIVPKQDPNRYILMTVDGEHYYINNEKITPSSRQKLLGFTSNVYGQSWRFNALNQVNELGVIDEYSYLTTWAFMGKENKGYSLEMMGYAETMENNVGETNLYLRKWLNGLSVDIVNPDPPEFTPDPNEPGGTTTPGGGGGNFDNTSDPIPEPPAPGIEISDTGFIRLYSPTATQINDLATFLWTGDAGDNLKKLFANPLDVIINLGILPLTIPTTGSETIKVGYIDTNIPMNIVSDQYITFSCGEISIDEYWGSALDYSPYTKISIYLPYIGERQLDVDEVMGSTISVKYKIDVLSGGCVCFILVNGSVRYQFSGNMMVQIPISSVDYKNVISSIVNITTAAATAIASGGMSAPFSAAMGVNAVATTANNVMNSKPTVSHGGSVGGMTGLLSVQTPFIIIQRPRQALPKHYNTFVGYPSNITKKLNEVSGFTKISDIHLENIPATDSELTEIENLLKGGVIL